MRKEALLPSLRVGGSRAVAAFSGSELVWTLPGYAWREINTGLFADAFRGVCYSPGLFVAVRNRTVGGGQDAVGTSPDGASWSWWPAVSESLWESVAWGNGAYASVASGATAGGSPRSMYSTEGRTWRASNIDTSIAWRSVCYGSSGFVAVGPSRVALSADGISWSASAVMGASSWRSVAFGNGVYVAVGSTGTNRIATSSDGVTWTTRAAPQANQWFSVTFYKGLFVACSISGTNRVMTSPDGITWTLRQNATGGSAIAGGDDTIVCGGGSYSFDGITWSQSTRFPTSAINGLAAGDGVFVAAIQTAGLGFGTSAATLGVSGSPSSSGRLFIDVTESPRTITQSATQSTFSGDANVTRRTAPQIVTDYVVSASSVVPNILAASVSSSNQAVLGSPNQAGLSVYASSGTATFTAAAGGVAAPARTIRSLSVQEASRDSFVSYRDGTVGHAASSAIDSALSLSPMRFIYSVKDHASKTYSRSSTSLASGLVDLSCVSVWNSAYGPERCGTLISPRHIIYAAHYPLQTGSLVRFVTQEGGVVERTVSARLTSPGYRPYFPDVEVAALDADVPGTVGFARVLPSNWRNYLTSVASGLAGVPVVYTNRHEEALVSEFVKDDGSVYCSPPSTPSRLSFFSALTSGDSGHPCFLVLGGGAPPVLLTVWTFGLSGRGTSVAGQSATINSMMTSLGGGYQLTPADLSAYTAY